MTIYPQKQYIPYTYLLGWTHIDLWYYGSEYGSKSKIANPNNLWNTYFTSSKHVASIREKYGDPDVVEIRKTFIDEETTRNWEHKVLKRLNASKNERWLNKSDGSLNSLNSEERSRISKERMADPVIKNKIMNSQKETMTALEYKQKRKRIAKEIWSRPEMRQKRKQTDLKPETIALKSKIQKEAQNRPEVKAKKSKTGKEAQNRPEVREKRSNSLKAAWNRPGFKDKIKELNKNRPVYYCECCNKHIKGESNWLQHLRSKSHAKNT